MKDGEERARKRKAGEDGVLCRGSSLCKDLEGHAVGCFPVAGAEERACRGHGVEGKLGRRAEASQEASCDPSEEY